MSGVRMLLIETGAVQLLHLDLTKGTLPLPGRLPKMDDGNLKYQLARSFDAALSQFIASEGSEADTAENRGRLAARLVVLSKLGETDEHQLASNAALYLRAFAGAMRIASSAKPAQAEADLTSHIALGPDAIDAMVEALHRCLDELPHGASPQRRGMSCKKRS